MKCFLKILILPLVLQLAAISNTVAQTNDPILAQIEARKKELQQIAVTQHDQELYLDGLFESLKDARKKHRWLKTGEWVVVPVVVAVGIWNGVLSWEEFKKLMKYSRQGWGEFVARTSVTLGAVGTGMGIRYLHRVSADHIDEVIAAVQEARNQLRLRKDEVKAKQLEIDDLQLHYHYQNQNLSPAQRLRMHIEKRKAALKNERSELNSEFEIATKLSTELERAIRIKRWSTGIVIAFTVANVVFAAQPKLEGSWYSKWGIWLSALSVGGAWSFVYNIPAARVEDLRATLADARKEIGQKFVKITQKEAELARLKQKLAILTE